MSNERTNTTLNCFENRKYENIFKYKRLPAVCVCVVFVTFTFRMPLALTRERRSEIKFVFHDCVIFISSR